MLARAHHVPKIAANEVCRFVAAADSAQKEN